MASSSSKVKNGTRKLFTYLALTLVVGMGLWFAIISPYLTRQEKNRFEAAHAELKSLAEETQTKTGPASIMKIRQSCGRANLKSEEGPLLCNTSVVLDFENTDVVKANELLHAAQTISNNPLREGPLAKSTLFIESQKNSVQIIYQDIGFLEKLSCVTSYEYRPSGLSNSDNLKVILNCGGPARAEHYPLED